MPPKPPMPEQLFAGVTEYPKLQGASSGLVGAAPVQVRETVESSVVQFWEPGPGLVQCLAALNLQSESKQDHARECSFLPRFVGAVKLYVPYVPSNAPSTVPRSRVLHWHLLRSLLPLPQHRAPSGSLLPPPVHHHHHHLTDHSRHTNTSASFPSTVLLLSLPSLHPPPSQTATSPPGPPSHSLTLTPCFGNPSTQSPPRPCLPIFPKPITHPYLSPSRQPCHPRSLCPVPVAAPMPLKISSSKSLCQPDSFHDSRGALARSTSVDAPLIFWVPSSSSSHQATATATATVRSMYRTERIPPRPSQCQSRGQPTVTGPGLGMGMGMGVANAPLPLCLLCVSPLSPPNPFPFPVLS